MKTTTVNLTQQKVGFITLTLIGLGWILFGQDLGWAGICLALAFAFDPLPEKNFKERPTSFKVWMVLQLAAASFCIGWNLYQVVSA